MKKILFLIIIVIIAGIAIKTNPEEKIHREAAKAELDNFIKEQKELKSQNTESVLQKAGLALGEVFGTALIDELINQTVTRENYYVFSTTNFTFNGKTKVIGFGAFGIVYITEEVSEALKEEFPEGTNINF